MEFKSYIEIESSNKEKSKKVFMAFKKPPKVRKK